MTRKSRREVTREVEVLQEEHAGDEYDVPPVFVEYGPDGEVVAPGAFGRRIRDGEDSGTDT